MSVCLQCSTARHSHRFIASMTKTVVSCNLTQYSVGARCAPRNRPAAVVQKGDGCRWVFTCTRLSHQTFSLTSLSHESFSLAKSFSVYGGVLGPLHSGKHSKQVAALQPHASNEASATSFSLVFLTVLSHKSFSRVFLISLPHRISLPPFISHLLRSCVHKFVVVEVTREIKRNARRCRAGGACGEAPPQS